MKTLAAITPVDMSPIGDGIIATFQNNLPTIATVASVLIGAAVVFRWIKRAAK